MKTDLQELRNVDCDEKVALTAELEVEELEAVIAPAEQFSDLLGPGCHEPAKKTLPHVTVFPRRPRIKRRPP